MAVKLALDTQSKAILTTNNTKKFQKHFFHKSLKNAKYFLARYSILSALNNDLTTIPLGADCPFLRKSMLLQLMTTQYSYEGAVFNRTTSPKAEIVIKHLLVSKRSFFMGR